MASLVDEPELLELVCRYFGGILRIGEERLQLGAPRGEDGGHHADDADADHAEDAEEGGQHGGHLFGRVQGRRHYWTGASQAAA